MLLFIGYMILESMLKILDLFGNSGWVLLVYIIKFNTKISGKDTRISLVQVIRDG